MAVVVTLEVAGVAYRWADVPVEVAADDGGWETIGAGVIRCEVDLAGDDSPGGASVEVDVAPLDLAELASLGHVLAGLPGEVAEVDDGQRWEDREILCTGTTSDLEYGELGATCSTQIGSTWLDQGLLPPPAAVVNITTWPARQDPAAGRPYPWIVGKPSSAPCLVVQTSGSYTTLDGTALTYVGLVAGHPVLATKVKVRNRDPGAAFGSYTEVNVYQGLDGAGRVVSVCNLSPFSGSIDTVQIEANWQDYEGGHTSVTGGGCPRSVPDVALVLLSYSTVPVDRGAWRAASWARPFLLDLYIAEPASPLDILRDAMRGMPGRIEAGPAGLRPVGTATVEVPGRAVGITLDDGTVDCDARIAVTGALPPGVIQVRYSTDSATKQTLSTAVLEIGQGPRAGRRSATYAPTGAGTVVEEVVCGHVCDAGTAARIAASIARERASRRRISWNHEADVEPHAHLVVGDRVELHHTGLHLSAQLAVVQAVDPALLDGTRRITARLVDDP